MRLLSIQHPKADYAGTFALAAREAGHVYDERCPGVGQPAPGDPAGYDGIVVLGGEQNVVDAPRLRYLQEVEALPDAAADPVFGALPERFSSYCWHSYGVELPEGAALLARSAVSIHGFRLGESAWGVQFHPEVTREILLSWFASYRDDPDAVALGFDPQVAEDELGDRLGPWEALGRSLFGAFAAAAADRVA